MPDKEKKEENEKLYYRLHSIDLILYVFGDKRTQVVMSAITEEL